MHRIASLASRSLALLVATAALIGVPAAPAAAAELPLQIYLRTAGGGPVPDGDYTVWLSVYDDAQADKPVWQHVYKALPVGQGLLSLAVGATLDDALDDALVVGPAPRWIGISIGTDAELPRVPLRSVPRATWAAIAASASFGYAAASTPGGAATSLDCSGCLTGAAIADSTILAKHVAFTYAGSDSKDGPANLALVAETAKVADNATTADAAATAKTADFATKAGTAGTADELACSGCVGIGHLADSVALGFLSTQQGGTVKGKVTFEAGVDLAGGALANSVLEGSRFATGDTTKLVCDAAALGRVVVDTVSSRLHFCDGKTWRRLSSCVGACKPADSVACAQPVVDDCGEPGACVGKGTFCAGGDICTGTGCKGPGEGQESAVASCKAVLDANPLADNGLWWLDPNGGAHDDAFEVWCDMKTKGGGWMKVSEFGETAYVNEASRNELLYTEVLLVEYEHASDPPTAGEVVSQQTCYNSPKTGFQTRKLNAPHCDTGIHLRIGGTGGSCGDTEDGCFGIYKGNTVLGDAMGCNWSCSGDATIWGKGYACNGCRCRNAPWTTTAACGNGGGWGTKRFWMFVR